MISVGSIADIPHACAVAASRPDGSWLCYMPWDTLPPEPALVI